MAHRRENSRILTGSVTECFKELSKLTPGKTPKTKIYNKLLQLNDLDAQTRKYKTIIKCSYNGLKGPMKNNKNSK